MIRINLLPHREEKRKQKKPPSCAAGAGRRGGRRYRAAGRRLQRARHLDSGAAQQVLKTAIVGLDKKIAEIATLKQEIEALKARQQAVEDLQGDRNQPVYLLDELVRRRRPAST
jgi:type IV pilus assembly protein PilN